MFKRFARYLFPVLMPLIVGCDFGPADQLPDIEIQRLENWPPHGELKPGVPGLDSGTVWYVREQTPNGRPLAIIWADSRCPGVNGSGKGAPGFRQTRATLDLENKKTIVLECKVEAGQHEPKIEFTIDGTPYDFRRGNFFLISTSGDKTRINQIDRDIGLKGMRFDLDSILETAKTDEQIRAFFTAASKTDGSIPASE